jgi:DNA topoisomerase-1
VRGAAGEGTLVVVESPRKALAIRRALGPGYEVMASLGHVKDLPPAGLGVDLDRGFEPRWQVLPARKRLLSEMRRVARRHARVLLATDPDREGEAIAWHLAEELGAPGGDGRVGRALIREITPEALREAVSRPVPLDAGRHDAQTARRVIDRLVGTAMTAALRERVGPGRSAGRVQAAALRLLVEREREVQAFRPAAGWRVEARLARVAGGGLRVRLLAATGEEACFREAGEAEAAAARLRAARFEVVAVERAEQPEPPPAPFRTVDLQAEAARRLGFRAARTMALARELYEGVDLGEEGVLGLLNYPRTDSSRVSAPAIAGARRLVAERFGEEQLSDGMPAWVDGGPRGQDAHEAIRPTSWAHPPEIVRPHLRRPGGRDLFRLYALVWERFLASQMRPALHAHVRLLVRAGEAELRASERSLRVPGWRAATGERAPRRRARPDPAPGEALRLEAVAAEPRPPEPPPRLDEAGLLRALDRLGIGRPSTYAGIAGALLAQGYAAEGEGGLRPTPLGAAVDRALAGAFTWGDPRDLTARVERRLDEVEAGAAGWREVVAEVWGALARPRKWGGVGRPFLDTLGSPLLRKASTPPAGNPRVFRVSAPPHGERPR